MRIAPFFLPVRLTAHLEGEGFVAFQVADTGIGIAREDQERIFEEFLQVESELQTRVKGTGLGLPLSKRLVELLGESIRVESEIGMGSTFHVRLPIHDRQVSRTARSATEISAKIPTSQELNHPLPSHHGQYGVGVACNTTSDRGHVLVLWSNQSRPESSPP
jgi:hypothetical protein